LGITVRKVFSIAAFQAARGGPMPAFEDSVVQRRSVVHQLLVVVMLEELNQLGGDVGVGVAGVEEHLRGADHRIGGLTRPKN
jgi:hypothetical protein